MASTVGFITSQAGSTVTIYTDSACTTLADIQDENGVAVPGSVLTIGTDSRIPRFKGPDGTPNGSDDLYALVQGNVAPGEPIYARYDDRLDTDTITRCSSSTHPSSPTDDQLIYEDDTNKILRYNTSSGLWLSTKRKYATDVVNVVANSASTSGTAELTLATSSVLVADGVTSFDIEASFQGLTSTVATDEFAYRLYEDATQLAQLNRYAQSTATGAGDGGTVKYAGRVPTAANHTYTLRLVRTAGTGTAVNLAAATSPTQIVVKESV